MRVLYHYEQSLFSRRCRLALAHKGIEVDLKDGRLDPTFIAEAREKAPIRTMPVFVEEDGRALGDSGAIVQYLDIAYPDRPRLVPAKPEDAKEALSIMVAIDVAMNGLVDLGTRFFELRHDPAWAAAKDERLARSQQAIEFVAKKTDRTFLAGDAWSAADIYAYAAARWVAAFPSRVGTSPQIANIITLGFTMPSALIDWTKQHGERPGVQAIYGS